MTHIPRFYLIGTKYDRSHDVMPRMIMDGVISTGFVDDLDLSPIVGSDYSSALDWVEAQIPKESGVAKSTLARFATMRPGDLVALKAHSAPNGNQPRLVIARYAVIAGESRAIYKRSDALGHTLKVDFLDEQGSIELPLGYGQTLHAIKDQERIDQIFGEYGAAARMAATKMPLRKEKATHVSEIETRGPYLMRRTHNKLQNEMYQILVEQFGTDSVKQEEDFVDLMVQMKNERILFEVKSSHSPIWCIREALGQLLHYGWKLGLHGNKVKYVIVGPSVAKDEDSAFLSHVVRETQLPITYCTPKTFIENNVLNCN